MSRTDSDRMTALNYLNTFRRHILPGTLRRIATWKSIPPGQLRDWLDDVHQELALDCLEHAETIVDLPDRQRHARWMRRTEKVIYGLRRQTSGQSLSVEEPRHPSSGRSPSELSSLQREPEVHVPALVKLSNGRTNLNASVRETGIPRRDLREQLNNLAAQLGWDQDRHHFWQSRVVEALTGLAADLLQLRGELRLLQPTRHLPDPERRAARLHRLSGRFPIQPSTRPARRALRPWTRSCKQVRVSPRKLLEQAVALDPKASAAWLWLFEACCVDGDPQAAGRALWFARRGSKPRRTAIVLARARLLELRGKLAAGMHLLKRAIDRWPHDSALSQALSAARTTAA